MKRERTTPESPKRGRGRPKGQPKTGGRVKRTRIQIARDKARDSIWDYVVKGLSGQAVKSRGPTGKQISQPLTEDNQIRLLQTAWRKLEPDLNATAVSADIVTEHVHTEPKDPRQVARAVLSVLEHAKLAEQAEHPVTDEPIAEPPPSWPEPPETLLLTRDDIIEISASDRSGPSTPTAALPGEPRDGDRIDVDENGAHIRFHEATKKWQVLDNLNIPHAWKPTREKALEFARTLPKSSGVPQSDPYGPAEVGLYGDERRDNRATMPGKSKIVRRMPRRSR